MSKELDMEHLKSLEEICNRYHRKEQSYHVTGEISKEIEKHDRLKDDYLRVKDYDQARKHLDIAMMLRKERERIAKKWEEDVFCGRAALWAWTPELIEAAKKGLMAENA